MGKYFRNAYRSNSPDKRPRRAAYALPTLFTAANVFLGFYAIIKSFEGVMLAMNGTSAQRAFEAAAMADRRAVFCDGIDGRLARMTNTVSDFGRSSIRSPSHHVRIAPPCSPSPGESISSSLAAQPGIVQEYIRPRATSCRSFIAVRIDAPRAIQYKRTGAKNPGRPDRKYFVGLAIPRRGG